MDDTGYILVSLLVSKVKFNQVPMGNCLHLSVIVDLKRPTNYRKTPKQRGFLFASKLPCFVLYFLRK